MEHSTNTIWNQWCPAVIKRKVTIRAEKLVKTSPNDGAFHTNRKFRVKISGDGTNIGKRLHVVNVTFTSLDEGDAAYSKSLKITSRFRNAFQIS